MGIGVGFASREGLAGRTDQVGAEGKAHLQAREGEGLERSQTSISTGLAARSSAVETACSSQSRSWSALGALEGAQLSSGCSSSGALP